MDTFICILKTLGLYIALMFIGANLVGMIIRSIKPTNVMGSDGQLIDLDPIHSKGNTATLILSIVLTIGYLFALYHFWNVVLAIAGAILMFARIPDLLYEMKFGKKVGFKNMPKSPVHIFSTILYWLVLPLIYYAICYFKID